MGAGSGNRGGLAGLSDRWGALARRADGKVAGFIVISTGIRNPVGTAISGG